MLPVVTLTRTVRFSINPHPPEKGKDSARARNTFSAYPSMRGLGRHYEMLVACRAEPDAVTGYAVDIHEIDRAVRDAALPVINAACRAAPETEPGEMLPRLWPRLNEALNGRLTALTWRLSPFYSVSMEAPQMSTVLLRQQFEFAAAHRLHAPTLTGAQNREIFGKCNNPSGHGHNYRVEPQVAVKLDSTGRQKFLLTDLERITDEVVLQRFDHKNLNRDLPEFASQNPSVENIARTIYEALAPAISGAGAKLRCVTVWETEKTACTYPAPDESPAQPAQ